jgi:DNA processing protein
MEQREAYIALNMIEGIGPVKVRALVECLGSPRAVLEADADALCRVNGIGPKLAQNVADQRDTVNVQKEIQAAAKQDIRIITIEEDEYPEVLRTIHDPPLALYVAGELRPEDRHAFAIVGSRRCTHYGKQVADRLAYQLAKVGYTVISGLARGIDTAAHQGALKGGGRTITVLGGAIDRLYPPENRKLAADIACQGAVISEFPLGREPDRTTFPYRNRIVSGLSQGVVVVEAPPRSGSLITAEAAMDQGRNVYAVPGRIDNPNARGCHRLLKQGACLVESVDDILHDVEMLLPPDKKERAREIGQRPDLKLSPEESRILQELGQDAVDVDTLARRSGLQVHQVSAVLMGLEMKRVVRMLPGRIVELVVSLDDIREQP